MEKWRRAQQQLFLKLNCKFIIKAQAKCVWNEEDNEMNGSRNSRNSICT